MPVPPTSLTRIVGALALLLSLSASNAIAIEDSVDHEILSGDWEGVYQALSSDSAKTADPALRILLGYACRFTNRLGDSDDWWEQVRAGTVDTQWARWTVSFLERHPGTAAGLYFASRGASIEDRDDEARKLLNAACKADKNFARLFGRDVLIAIGPGRTRKPSRIATRL